jgi:hypothetical protein
MSRKKQREPETAVIDSATHDGKGIASVTGKKVFVHRQIGLTLSVKRLDVAEAARCNMSARNISVR